MAPTLDVQSSPATTEHIKVKGVDADASQSQLIRQPLQYSGTLDEYRHFETTPVIGTEFSDLQLADILDDDAKIRDLAITGEGFFCCGSSFVC